MPVYLDQWAIIDLAVRKADLRKRFIDAIHAGRGPLLFSIANLWEIGGPQQASKSAVSTFLSDIGPHWIPVNGVGEVLKREASSELPQPTSSDFLADYVLERRNDKNAAGCSIDPRDPSFFDLGRVAHWVKSGPDPVTVDSVHGELCSMINMMRARYESGDPVFDGVAEESLVAGQRTTYVFRQLTLMMIQDAKSNPVTKHDFADLCHAIMALSFGLIVTLDKKWRDRAKAVKHRDKLARVYYAPELEQFVADLESATPPWEQDIA